MKAVETMYGGCRMRSRLEGRWAVFMDAIDVKWQYEPETFELPQEEFPHDYTGKTWYLPDFYLPDYEVYVEIKPKRMTYEESVKSIVFGHFKPIYVIQGSPGINNYFVSVFDPRDYTWTNVDMCFALGRKCYRLWISSDYGCSDISCKNCPESKCGEKETGPHLSLEEPYAVALSARFEIGSTFDDVQGGNFLSKFVPLARRRYWKTMT